MGSSIWLVVTLEISFPPLFGDNVPRFDLGRLVHFFIHTLCPQRLCENDNLSRSFSRSEWWHTWTQTCICEHTHAYITTHTHASAHTHIWINIKTHTYKHTILYRNPNTQAHKHVYVNTNKHVYMNTHTRVHIINTQIYTQTHACKRAHTCTRRTRIYEHTLTQVMNTHTYSHMNPDTHRLHTHVYINTHTHTVFWWFIFMYSTIIQMLHFLGLLKYF